MWVRKTDYSQLASQGLGGGFFCLFVQVWFSLF